MQIEIIDEINPSNKIRLINYYITDKVKPKIIAISIHSFHANILY